MSGGRAKSNVENRLVEADLRSCQDALFKTGFGGLVMGFGVVLLCWARYSEEVLHLLHVWPRAGEVYVTSWP